MHKVLAAEMNPQIWQQKTDIIKGTKQKGSDLVWAKQKFTFDSVMHEQNLQFLGDMKPR